MSVTLSVLDFVPLRTDQTTSDAISASVVLAETADRLGYERYWVSEHHDMPYASTHPGVLISMLAAKTQRIRVGSGGVMMPNHTAFDVAEQFAFLEAAYPGRIDLGVGRAPAGSPASILALRGGSRIEPGNRFPQEVDSIIAMLQPEGVAVHLQGRPVPLKATAVARSVPDVWMLGSSPRSAALAAEAGVPYVYAHHFFGTGTDEAVDTYRSHFRPSAHTAQPRLLALPNLIHTVDALTGRGEQPLLLVEEAEAQGIRPGLEVKADQLKEPWVVGTPEQARAQIETFARRHDVDEIMIQPIAGAYAGTAPDRGPANETTLALLAPLESGARQENAAHALASAARSAHAG